MKNLIEVVFLALGLVLFSPIAILGQNPNTDPNWDWHAGDDSLNHPFPATQYRMYVETNGSTVPLFRNAPWGQPNITDAQLDHLKEDGWVLVCRDFGTPTRPIFALNQAGTAYFILYNKYRSILRVFTFIKSGTISSLVSAGGMEAKFVSDKKTFSLTHFNPVAFATDKLDSVKDNSSTSLTPLLNNERWIWADYPIAYDPTIVSTSEITAPRVLFTIKGTTESQLVIRGSTTGVNGQPEDVRTFLSGSTTGSVLIGRTLPINQNTFNFSNLATSVGATSEKWAKFGQTVGKIAKRIIPQDGDLANFANALKSILQSVPLIEHLPILKEIWSLVDFFIGGGKKNSPELMAPTFTAHKLDLNGTIKTEFVIDNPASLVIPASKSNALIEPVLGSFVPIVYNKHLGIFNLTQSPVIKYKTYTQQIPYSLNVLKTYLDLQVQNFQYAVNPDADLVLESIEASIVSTPALAPEDEYLFSEWIGGNLLNLGSGHRKVRLENAMDNEYEIGTLPVRENAFQGETLQIPANSDLYKVFVKVKVVLRRKDNPALQPVVFVAKYKPVFIQDGTGRYPVPPVPPPAPSLKVVNVTKQYEFNGSLSMSPIFEYGLNPVALSVPLEENFSGRLYRFVKWSDGSRSNSRFISDPGVTSLTAEYKAKLLSSIPDASAQGAQRRVVHDEIANRTYAVYESNGKIWITCLVNGSSLSAEYLVDEGKNPSIDVRGGNIAIAYLSGGTVRTKFLFFLNGTFLERDLGITQPSHIAIQNSKPVISLFTGSMGIILYDAIVNNEKCVLYHLGIENSSNWSWSGGTLLANSITSSNLCSFPSVIRLSSDKACVIWQKYISVSADQASLEYTEITSLGSQSTTTVVSYFGGYQSFGIMNQRNPTIAVEPNGTKHIAWEATDINTFRNVVVYASIPSNNTPPTVLTKFDLGNYGAIEPTINWANNSVSLMFKGYGINFTSKPTNTIGSWSALQYFSGNAPNIVASGSKRYAYTTGSASPYQIQFGEISTGGGGSAQERTLSGGNSGTISPVATTLGGTPTPTPSFQLAERITARLSSEDASAFLELTLADIALNGRSRAGLTFHHLGASLLEDGTTLTPQTVFKTLKSRSFTIADSVTQVSAVVKVRSETLYGLTSNANPQLAVELFNAETNQSLALSQTVLVSNADTAKDFHFTMALLSSSRGTVAELRVKVLGFAPQSSHQPSALNTITLLDGEDGAAILNRVGGGASESVGSVPTKVALNQNYPNPFNPTTMIRYELTEASPVKLQVFDMLGRVVATVVNERRDAGIYEVPFNASGLSSGTYFYRLQAGTFIETKKMMLIK